MGFRASLTLQMCKVFPWIGWAELRLALSWSFQDSQHSARLIVAQCPSLVSGSARGFSAPSAIVLHWLSLCCPCLKVQCRAVFVQQSV